jgi:hypothetical protein
MSDADISSWPSGLRYHFTFTVCPAMSASCDRISDLSEHEKCLHAEAPLVVGIGSAELHQGWLGHETGASLSKGGMEVHYRPKVFSRAINGKSRRLKGHLRFLVVGRYGDSQSAWS